MSSAHPVASRPGYSQSRQPVADLLEMARTHLDMAAAFVSEVTEDSVIFRHVDSGCPVPFGPGDRKPAGETYCQRILDGRLPAVIPNTADFPEAMALEVTEALGIGAYLSVPVQFTDGSMFGTICCYSGVPDVTLNERDASFLRIMARAVAELLEREHLEVDRHDRIVGRLRQVIAEDRLRIVYQPIVDLAHGHVAGLEALSRFDTDPYRTPDVWFSDAAVVGMGVELEIAATRQAAAALGRFDGYLAMNFSAATILTPSFASFAGSLPLPRIVLEVSEHDAITDYDLIAAALSELRVAGLRLAVDDAGAGFASLRHIVRLAPDLIKLDISLVNGIATDRVRQAMATALVSFARETGTTVVAEGIEGESDLRAVRRIGVQYGQGYHLGRPGPLQI